MNDEQIKQAETEMLERAGAFESFVGSKGWELLKAWVENHIQDFANQSITKGYESMDQFNYARGYVNGLRELLVEVNSHLEQLEAYRRRAK